MNPTTAQAFFDELEKIARVHQSTEIGRLVNADKEEFPTSNTDGLVPKRGNRLSNQPMVSATSPDPEEKTPEATNEQGGLTF